MHNLIIPAPPPAMDSFAPEFCFCGRKTVRSHEYWFCSTECARIDSLRSLGDPECHYRNVVRKAYLQAGIPELYPRRKMSVDKLRHDAVEHHGFANGPSRVLPPTQPSHQKNGTPRRRDAYHGNTEGFPMLSQVAGKVLTKTTTGGEPSVPGGHDRPRLQGLPNPSSRANPAQTRGDHTFEQISLDVIPLPDHVPAHPLRQVPLPSDGPKTSIGKSVTALLNVGRSRKGKEGEKVFGHYVNVVTPPVRKESLPLHRQMSPSSADPMPRLKALRRSASFSGKNPQSGPSNGRDTVMHVIEELREEYSESFDPRSFFHPEEDD